MYSQISDHRRVVATLMVTLSLVAEQPAAARPTSQPVPPGQPTSRPHVGEQPASRPADTARLKRARSLFSEGNTRRRMGDLEGALMLFRQVERMHPGYKIDLNLATTLFELKRHAEAARHFARFLRTGAERSPPYITARARERFRASEGRVGQLVIRCLVPGAEVMVDDVTVGRTPLVDPVYLLPGPRRLTVRKSGHRSFEQQVTARAGVKERVTVDLAVARRVTVQPLATAAAARRATLLDREFLASRSRRRRKTLIGWTAAGTSLALAVGTAVLYGVGSRLGDDADDRYHALGRGDPESSYREALDDINEARRMLIGGHVLFGTAAVAAGVAIWQLATRPASPRRESAAEHLDIGPAAHGQGLSLTARF